MKPKLLTRDEFREGTFARDNYKCVFCGEDAKDAHHIIERRLFDNGGYFLDNGASVCEKHHIMCETTEFSLDQVREACGITTKVIPDHLYPDYEYDKWGNLILDDGRRTMGELFHDPSVQKILAKGGKLDLFTNYVKYPRTYHLPWSGCIGKDDRILKDYSAFVGRRVIATVKMDGSNITMYNDYIHGRSFNERTHPISGRVKALWSQFQANIPDGWRVCGEDLFNTHSIHYNALNSFLYGYAIWTDQNICLSWDETIEYFQLLDITPVDVVYDGIWDESKLKTIVEGMDFSQDEGIVVRPADSFSLFEFKSCMAKYVRPDHHKTVVHNLAGKKLPHNLMK